MNRIITALIAFAFLGLTPFALSGPASAAPSHVSATAHHTVVAKKKPKRDLHEKIVNRGPKTLIFKGRVDPGHGPVIVQRKTCKACAWKLWNKVQTKGKFSQWSSRVGAPRRGYWYYRAFVPAYGGYAKSKTDVYKTYSI